MPILIDHREISCDVAGEIALPCDDASHCTQEALVSTLKRPRSGSSRPNSGGLGLPAVSTARDSKSAQPRGPS